MPTTHELPQSRIAFLLRHLNLLTPELQTMMAVEPTERINTVTDILMKIAHIARSKPSAALKSLTRVTKSLTLMGDEGRWRPVTTAIGRMARIRIADRGVSKALPMTPDVTAEVIRKLLKHKRTQRLATIIWLIWVSAGRVADVMALSRKSFTWMDTSVVVDFFTTKSNKEAKPREDSSIQIHMRDIPHQMVRKLRSWRVKPKDKNAIARTLKKTTPRHRKDFKPRPTIRRLYPLAIIVYTGPPD